MALSNADRQRAYRRQLKESGAIAVRTAFIEQQERLEYLENRNTELKAFAATLAREIAELEKENHRLRAALMNWAVPT
jgi:predicted RNase H-like nuclease (RuvC/YqgF family)